MQNEDSGECDEGEGEETGVGSSFRSERSSANISDDFGCLIGEAEAIPENDPHLVLLYAASASPDAAIVHCLIALLTPLLAQTNNNCVRAEDKNVSGRYKMP